MDFASMKYNFNQSDGMKNDSVYPYKREIKFNGQIARAL